MATESALIRKLKRQLEHSLRVMPMRDVSAIVSRSDNSRLRLDLFLLSSRTLVAGELAVLTGNQSGWRDIYLASLYQYWGFTACPQFGDVEGLSMTLLRLAGFSDRSRSTHLASLLMRAETSSIPTLRSDPTTFYNFELPSLAAVIWCLGNNTTINDRHAKRIEAVAPSVTREWNSTYGQAVAEIVELHVRWSTDSDDNGIVARGDRAQCAPFQAVRALRRSAGMPTSVPDHPLLQSPFRLPAPEHLDISDDPLWKWLEAHSAL